MFHVWPQCLHIIEVDLIIEAAQLAVHVPVLGGLRHLRRPAAEVDLERLGNVVNDNLQLGKLGGNQWNVLDGGRRPCIQRLCHKLGVLNMTNYCVTCCGSVPVKYEAIVRQDAESWYRYVDEN